MSTSARKKTYRSTPPRWVGAGQVCWVLGALVAVAALGVFWNAVLLDRQLASSRDYVGQLNPDTDPVVVLLPRGAVLDEVLIARDDEIRSGQTLATLDTAAMAHSAALLEREMLHDNVLHECVLNTELPSAKLAEALPKEGQDFFHRAVQGCQSVLDERTEIDRRLDVALALQEEERDLVARYIQVLNDKPQTAVSSEQKQRNDRQVLALALLGNKLDRQMSRTRLWAKDALKLWNDERLERVRRLAEGISVKTEIRRRLQALMDTPRLIAPQSGWVTRVRHFGSETGLDQDIELMELRTKQDAGFEAYFDVPRQKIQGIKVGNRVRMKMLGLLEHGPVLFGHVNSLHAADGNMVRASVSLEETSLVLLDDPEMGLALRGRGTAARIQVKKDDQRIGDLLQARFRKDLFGDAKPWLTQQIAAAVRSDTPPPPGP